MGFKKISPLLSEMENNAPKPLSENLKNLLKSHHLNVIQLAEALNVPMMTIRRLVLGETMDPRISTLKLIADYFHISVDTLINDHHHVPVKSLEKTNPVFVPVLSWDIMRKMNTLNDIDLSTWKEWQPLSLSEPQVFSENTFALESRPAIYPRFPQGTIFIIDPDVLPEDGDIVLVKFTENGELTLRELIIDPPDWYLYALVPSSNKIQFSKKYHKIAGVNLLTLLYSRKS